MAYSRRIQEAALDLCRQGLSSYQISDALRKRFPKKASDVDPRTVRRWCQSLKEESRKSGESERHRQDMVNIAQTLSANDLAFTTRRHIDEIDADLYSIRYKGNYTKEQLSGKLGTNIAQAMDFFPPESIDGFAAHVKAEYPQLQGDKLSEITRHNPFELIRACSLISKRGNVKFMCQICKGQQ